MSIEPSKVIVIESSRTSQNYWLDLWRYRELFAVIAWRDLSVRYKQNDHWASLGVDTATHSNWRFYDHFRVAGQTA